LVWKSQLRAEISLSTLEAEYSALSQALRTFLPLECLLLGNTQTVGLPAEIQATILAEVFEDNQGCLALATNHRLTNRTKYFHVKWHWFWYYFAVQREFQISSIKSTLHDADFLTKQTPQRRFSGQPLPHSGLVMPIREPCSYKTVQPMSYRGSCVLLFRRLRFTFFYDLYFYWFATSCTRFEREGDQGLVDCPSGTQLVVCRSFWFLICARTTCRMSSRFPVENQVAFILGPILKPKLVGSFG
jgi:hypothetical protein